MGLPGPLREPRRTVSQLEEAELCLKRALTAPVPEARVPIAFRVARGAIRLTEPARTPQDSPQPEELSCA